MISLKNYLRNCLLIFVKRLILFKNYFFKWLHIFHMISCTSKYITDNAKIKDIIKNPSQKGRTQI